MPIRCVPPTTGRSVVQRWTKAMRFTPDLDERAAVLGLVGHPTRFRLFYVLAQLGEACGCDLASILGISQAAISQHLAKFKAYGLVTARREAQTVYYGLSTRPEVKMLRTLALNGIEHGTAAPRSSARRR